MMPIIPMPVYIHNADYSSLNDYIFPGWVNFLLVLSVGILFIGIIGLFISMILAFCFDIDIDLTFRISIFLSLGGGALFLITLMCMALTGVPAS